MAIDLDVVTRLNRATTREAAREAQRYFKDAGDAAGADFGDGLSRGITAKTPEVEKALKRVQDASGKVIVEQEKLNDLQAKGTATKSQLIAQSERVAKAYREEESALRAVNNVMTDHQTSLREVEVSGGGAISTLTNLGSTMGSLGKVAGPTLLIGGLMELTSVASAASGVIGLLPGVLGAAGAAFGSLKIATLGFGEALESVKDPEKFSETLAALSPAAQQAALSIQALMPSFEQLRSATQDALFQGVGEQLNSFTNAYLPAVQGLTTGISSAFNRMFMDLTNELMQPDTMSSINSMMDNIVAAFQNLTPAIAPLTHAFAQLAQTGSSFLPDIASAASQAAQSFADFINEAQRTGQLRQWIQDGITVMGQLLSLTDDVTKMFAALGPTGMSAMTDIKNVVEFTSSAVRVLTGDLSALGDMFPSLANMIIGLGNKMAEPFRWIISALNALGADIPQIPDYATATEGLKPGQFRGGGGSFDPATAGVPGVPGGGYSVPRPSGGLGSTALAPAAGPSWGPRPNPFAWDPKKGSADAIPTFNPSQYEVGPGPLGPSLEYAGAAGGVAPGMGYGQVDPDKVYDAESAALRAKNTLEQDRLRVLELEAKGNASQREILSAKNQVQEDERAYTKAQRELIEAQHGSWKKANDAIGDLNSVFVALDSDFGVSGGLPGIVKNLTAFLGNLALGSAIGSSPTLQAAAFSLMNPNVTMGGGYSQGGFGGQQLLAGYGGPGISGAPTEDQVKQIAAAFGLQVTSEDRPGDPGYHGRGMALDVSNGSANTPQMLAFAQYMAQNFGSSLKELIYSDPAFGQLIGDGKNVSGTGYYSPSTLGDHQNHVHVAAQWGSGAVPGATIDFSSFGPPGSKQATANMVYQQALSRGYSPHEAQSILAYAIGESGLNAGISGGIQGGGGDPFADTVQGLFQEKPAFAQGGGISPAQRTDPAANTFAYLNQLEKYRHLPIEQALPATSVGGPLAPGGEQPWGPLMQQAAGYINPGQMTSWGPNAGIGTPGVGGGPGWATGMGPGPLPTSAPSGQGGGFGYPSAPGVGGAVGTSGMDSLAQSAGPGGGGGLGAGGGLMDAAMAGTAALDIMAPGAGQAAKVGIQLANRAIKFGSQAAAIGVSGVMETFLPHNSALGDPGKSWFGKIAGGIAGARPAAPNAAGKSAPPQPVDPNTTQHGQGQGQPPGPMVHIETQNVGHNDGQGVANDIARQQYSMYSVGGPR